MPTPHHGHLDSLGLDTPPRAFDRSVPLLGKLGSSIRKRRRGMGYALGNSFYLSQQLARTHVFSRRFWVLLRRHWLSMLAPVAYLAVFGSLIILIMNSKSIYWIGAWFAYIAGSIAYSILRKSQLEAWPSFTTRLRRQALLYSSNRYRTLHPDAGQGQSAGQIASYIAHRREHWIQRLEALTTAERNAMAYREHWWLAMVPMIAILPIILDSTGTMKLGNWFLPSLILVNVLVFGAPTLASKRRFARIRSCLTDFTCPDCSYPLADFANGSFKGQSVPGLGPRACIECGTPWPLLPPPITRAKPKRSLFSRRSKG